MAFPGYAPFSYGQSSQPQQGQQPNYFSYAQNSYTPYPYASTPRYATNTAYLPQGTPYSNQVPFPAAGGAYPNNGGPSANIPETSPAPFIPPMPEGGVGYDLKPHHSSGKKHHKSSSTPGPSANTTPIKSAMKRSATVLPPAAQPQFRTSERKRTGSMGAKQAAFQPSSQNGSPVTRTRTKSDVKASLYDLTAEMERFEPDHMFVYFQGNNEFVAEYVTSKAQGEIRQHLESIWTEGLEEDKKEMPPTHLHIKFRGTPWNMTGSHKEKAWTMIITIFRIFALRGYGLSSVINLGFPPARLVFCKQPRDNSTGFFLAFFSKSGFRVTLVNPPRAVDTSVVMALHKAFPGFIERNELSDTNIRILELSKEAQKKPRKLLEHPSRDQSVEPSYFLMRVLQAISEIKTFRLECTLPLGASSGWTSSSRGPSDIGSQKEIYVFGGMDPGSH